MSRKSGGPSNLILALLVLIGVGGVLGLSSFNVKVSVVGSVVILAAILESALILGGMALLNRKQPHPGSTSEST